MHSSQPSIINTRVSVTGALPSFRGSTGSDSLDLWTLRYIEGSRRAQHQSGRGQAPARRDEPTETRRLILAYRLALSLERPSERFWRHSTSPRVRQARIRRGDRRNHDDRSLPPGVWQEQSTRLPSNARRADTAGRTRPKVSTSCPRPGRAQLQLREAPASSVD